jgi:hypothetical protein
MKPRKTRRKLPQFEDIIGLLQERKPMKTYVAPTNEIAAGLHNGTITELVIPCDPQPDGAARFSGCDRPEPYISDRKGSARYFAIGEFCPYQPGDRIAVKEACWMDQPFHALAGLATVYAADVANRPKSTNPPFQNWIRYSASRMPIREIRTHLICHSSACRQVDGVWCWVVKVTREGTGL